MRTGYHNCISEVDGQNTLAHSINVSLLSMLMGKWLKYDFGKLRSLVTGFLHDIGKCKVQEILNKPRKLKKKNSSKKHCVIGYQLESRSTA